MSWWRNELVSKGPVCHHDQKLIANILSDILHPKALKEACLRRGRVNRSMFYFGLWIWRTTKSPSEFDDFFLLFPLFFYYAIFLLTLRFQNLFFISNFYFQRCNCVILSISVCKMYVLFCTHRFFYAYNILSSKIFLHNCFFPSLQ